MLKLSQLSISDGIRAKCWCVEVLNDDIEHTIEATRGAAEGYLRRLESKSLNCKSRLKWCSDAA